MSVTHLAGALDIVGVKERQSQTRPRAENTDFARRAGMMFRWEVRIDGHRQDLRQLVQSIYP
jgi:hypothetical protein